MSEDIFVSPKKWGRIAVLLSGRGSNFRAIHDAVAAGRINAEVDRRLADLPVVGAGGLGRQHVDLGLPESEIGDIFFVGIQPAGVLQVVFAGEALGPARPGVGLDEEPERGIDVVAQTDASQIK